MAPPPPLVSALTMAASCTSLPQGILLRHERQGNIYAENRSSESGLEVTAWGWEEPGRWSLSEDVIAARGRVGSQEMKVLNYHCGTVRWSMTMIVYD